MNSTLSSYELATFIANLADDRKAKDTLMLMTEQVSTLADYFIISTVESRTQMRALADQIQKSLKQLGLEPLGQEVDKGGQWSLLDYGDVVVHLFHQDNRAYYNLERFWNHATEIPREQWSREELQAS